jgi:DNA-binding LytR/AlgR family response regulator
VEKHSPEIVLLDIQMPEFSGLEFIKRLEKPVNIILTTAYQQFALDGFELDVVDYLLKPISYERFLKAINKVRSRQIGTSTAGPGERLIKSGHSIYRVRYSDIQYIEGMREYVRYHTSDSWYMELVSLKHLEESLPFPMFKRVHKSFIVNLRYASSLHTGYMMINERKIPVGLTYRHEVSDWFNKNNAV